jgi:glycosyltransferase involved in cell wall biosynthesis
VYDAHEYFTQQKEILTRPKIYRFWRWIEKNGVPRFKKGYTVSSGIAFEFRKTYGVEYEVIRNVPLLVNLPPRDPNRGKTVLYQGAVNEARGLEYLVPAMKHIDASLHIYGDGNFLAQTKELIKSNNLEDKVLLKGKLLPDELVAVTSNAYIGINLVENNGLNQYLSLANKFFDYMHCGLPQVSMNFPEYRKVNDEFEVALLIDEPETLLIAAAVNRLLNDEKLYLRLHQNCLEARNFFNWQLEEKKLVRFYQKLFADS